jgi:hypothetical protein
MKRHISSVVMILLALILSAAAQTATSDSPTSPAFAQVPPVIQFANVANDESGTPLPGPAEITFSVYNNAQGGKPLWSETQNVTLDNSGHYSVYLGITKPNGVPMSLFTSGQAHWLGVQIAGQAEQPRVFIVSVPYAMKAGDAATVGGLPPSAFVMANPASSGHASGKASNPLTETQNYVPIFTNGSGGLGNSILYESGGNEVGIGTTTPAATLEVNGTAKFDGQATFASGQTFPGTVTGVGAGTGITVTGTKTNPTININTKFANQYYPQLNAANTFTGNQTVNGNLSATGVVTGGSYQIGSNLFAFGNYGNGNAFLGFAGNLTMTGTINTAVGVSALLKNTTGSFNTASGENALFSNSSGNYNTASGVSALSSNTTAGYNTATGYVALSANTTGSSNTATGGLALQLNTTGYENTATGLQALNANTTGTYNTASGALALDFNTTGIQNTADGAGALNRNTAGNYNTASGYNALTTNSTASYNTAVGYNALGSNQTGSSLTCIGYACGVSVDGLVNATAIGANAFVGQSNTLVLGGTGANQVAVGIGTTTPQHVFEIAQGAGIATADGWDVYSSRRWKTNIHTLHGALQKVERLRGVTYDLKNNGKHEVGVIAEEVGAVVPEIVSWDKNGKDAQGVDYGRLTALLIEATKEQHTLIHIQQQQIRVQQKQMKAQQAQIAGLSSQVKAIQASLKTTGRTGSEVRTVKAQVAMVHQ